MQNNNFSKAIVFEGKIDVFDSVREILEKNGFKETLADYSKKVGLGETPWFDILYSLLKKLATEEITDVEFSKLLIPALPCSSQSAEKILLETKEKIIPTVRVLTDTDLSVEEPEEEESDYEAGADISQSKIMKPDLLTLAPESPPKKINSVKKPAKLGEKTTNSNQTKSRVLQKQSGGDDKYREPIE